jgi:hypothetical protein
MRRVLLFTGIAGQQNETVPETHTSPVGTLTTTSRRCDLLAIQLCEWW